MSEYDAGWSTTTTSEWPPPPYPWGPSSPDPGAAAPSPPSAPPPSRSRWHRGRGFLGGVVVGALVGGLTAAGVVAVTDDDPPVAPSATPAATSSSVIAHEGTVQEVLAAVGPAVVSVQSTAFQGGGFFGNEPQQGAGSGVVVSADGVIVTNAHVVAGADSIEVTFSDGTTEDATVLGADPTHDLAVLDVDATDLPTATLGDSDALSVGDDVVAIGNALALTGGPTVTTGIVSALDRTIVTQDAAGGGGNRLQHLIQTDAAINPGNSGGPLVDSQGRVVGINTAVAGGAENIGFAIPASEAEPVIEELRQGRVPSSARLGIEVTDVTPDVADQLGVDVQEGAVVGAVADGSAAADAGIRAGDVIVSFDGDPVATADDLVTAVRSHEPGDEVDVEVVRQSGTETVTVTLGRANS
jgi:S1-C subfamily serine protease